jgi:hypothetical protein
VYNYDRIDIEMFEDLKRNHSDLDRSKVSYRVPNYPKDVWMYKNPATIVPTPSYISHIVDLRE